MKKRIRFILKVTVLMVLTISSLLSLSSCILISMEIDAAQKERNSEEIMNTSMQGDYTIVVKDYIRKGDERYYIDSFLPEEEKNDKYDNYSCNSFAYIGDRLYQFYFGNMEDEIESAPQKHVILGYIDLKTIEFNIISSFEAILEASSLATSRILMNSQYIALRIQKENVPNNTDNIIPIYEYLLIYNYIEETEIKDSEFKEELKDYTFARQNPLNDSFTYDGIEYLIKEVEDNEYTANNLIVNTQNNEERKVFFSDIKRNSPNFTKLQEKIEQYEITERMNINLFERNGELYANAVAANKPFDRSYTPSHLFKYNFDKKEFEYIASSEVFSTVSYVNNNSKN